ncbi:hypothetical protein BFL35_09625 [Clavibacter michiganensis]|nr:hypothetical protein BFL35_09625 [Clavibacter michiganensis]
MPGELDVREPAVRVVLRAGRRDAGSGHQGQERVTLRVVDPHALARGDDDAAALAAGRREAEDQGVVARAARQLYARAGDLGEAPLLPADAEELTRDVDRGRRGALGHDQVRDGDDGGDQQDRQAHLDERRRPGRPLDEAGDEADRRPQEDAGDGERGRGEEPALPRARGRDAHPRAAGHAPTLRARIPAAAPLGAGARPQNEARGRTDQLGAGSSHPSCGVSHVPRKTYCEGRLRSRLDQSIAGRRASGGR